MDSYHQQLPKFGVRSARATDIHSIFSLIDSMTSDGTLLGRSRSEIEQQLATFIVAHTDQGEFLGCAALHRYGAHLAEVRSIAVRPEARGLGAGALLLQRLLDDVRQSGTQCTCLFTRIPDFFARYGFHAVPISAVVDKVAKDCVRCARRQHCDEVAMAYGHLPFYAASALVPAAQQLVQL